MATLEEIKLQCRERADMVQNQFISESELTSYVNNSLAELHDLLIAAYCEDYYMNEANYTTIPDQKEYALPADFYKLRGVDVNFSNQWTTVKRFNFNRRNEDQNAYAWNLLGLPLLEYRLVGSNIRFNRGPNDTSEFRIFYYPKSVVLVAPTDEFVDINGYLEYVIVDVAIKMLNKEESDVTVLAGQKAALKQRLEAMANNRDANEPESVTDITNEGPDVYWLTRV